MHELAQHAGADTPPRKLIARRPRLQNSELILILLGVATFGTIYCALAYLSGETYVIISIIIKYVLFWICIAALYLVYRNRLLRQAEFSFDDEYLYVSTRRGEKSRFPWINLTRISLPGKRGLELHFTAEQVDVPFRYYNNADEFLRHLGEVAPATSHAVVHVACIGSGEFLRAYKGTKELK